MKTTGSDQGTVRVTPARPSFHWRRITTRNCSAAAGYPVDEVYGKFPPMCHGVVPLLGDTLSEADLRNYIRLLERHGIALIIS